MNESERTQIDVLALDAALTQAEERKWMLCEYGCGPDTDDSYVRSGFTLIPACPVHGWIVGVLDDHRARAEAAEKERDEARHDWRMYVHEIEDEKARADAEEARAEAAEESVKSSGEFWLERVQVAERERDAVAKNAGTYLDRQRAAEARSADLEEDLRKVIEASRVGKIEIEGVKAGTHPSALANVAVYHLHTIRFIADAALAPAPPTEECTCGPGMGCTTCGGFENRVAKARAALSADSDDDAIAFLLGVSVEEVRALAPAPAEEEEGKYGDWRDDPGNYGE